MGEADFDAFAELLDDIAELRQLPVLSARAKALFFRAVAHFPLSVVQRAIEAYLVDPEEGRYRTMPQPAHVLSQIQRAAERDGRPEADEAWAIALCAQDEDASVVWTDEMARAFAVARGVFASGDEVGARVAFRAAYNRAVHAARHACQPMRWLLSPGRNPTMRDDAMRTAVMEGKLKASDIAGLLASPQPGDPETPAIDHQALRKLRAMVSGTYISAEALQLAEQADTRQAMT
ncbi:Uncharacterised protein [Bordetella ansorpii]|uniref:Uncharacterized protein n=1 Tax=Bordetella ansorpii TaxID=288768 RepID=A0A157RLU4_9BORD|nr:hypothetical protein [Bordetella ansorpii]SAI58970.1 Uncharacterised protein [Bordetella ansorpii]